MGDFYFDPNNILQQYLYFYSSLTCYYHFLTPETYIIKLTIHVKSNYLSVFLSFLSLLMYFNSISA